MYPFSLIEVKQSSIAVAISINSVGVYSFFTKINISLSKVNLRPNKSKNPAVCSIESLVDGGNKFNGFVLSFAIDEVGSDDTKLNDDDEKGAKSLICCDLHVFG